QPRSFGGLQPREEEVHFARSVLVDFRKYSSHRLADRNARPLDLADHLRQGDDAGSCRTNLPNLNAPVLEVVGPGRDELANAVVPTVDRVVRPLGERMPHDIGGKERKERLNIADAQSVEALSHELQVLLRHAYPSRPRSARARSRSQ